MPNLFRNIFVVTYKCGDPGISIIPDFSIKPLDSKVFIDDSDSTPLISLIFNFVTGCSYATIDRVSNDGVERPLSTDGV